MISTGEYFDLTPHIEQYIHSHASPIWNIVLFVYQNIGNSSNVLLI